jgi:hypothetical protein
LGNPAEETFCRPNQIQKNYLSLCVKLGRNAIRTFTEFALFPVMLICIGPELTPRLQSPPTRDMLIRTFKG